MGKKLPDAAIQDLTRWVKMGAPFPETPPEQRRVVPKPWSFEPVKDPASPVVRDTSWPLTSVDPFILEKIESRGLRPSPRAEKRTLIRRATYDLTGMPPEPEEVDRFLADPAPDAFTRLVDRLLASPRYGEHWGRHWLDVVRYADTAGDTADYPVPEAWRYRNYVIDSFNADKPYDEFIREQIAGDIMAGQGPPDKYAERVTATGYLALSRRFGFDSENYQHLTIQDAIDTMGQSVLGLTTGCARCHDHKFDPISTQDYYGLYGIFESTRFSFPGSEQKGKYRAMVPLVSAGESRAKWQEMQARLYLSASCPRPSCARWMTWMEILKCSGPPPGAAMACWFPHGCMKAGSRSPRRRKALSGICIRSASREPAWHRTPVVMGSGRLSIPPARRGWCM